MVFFVSMVEDKLQFCDFETGKEEVSNSKETDDENRDNTNVGHQDSKSPLTRQVTEDTYTLEYERCTAWGDVNTHTLGIVESLNIF